MVRKINARLVLRLRSQGLSFAQIEAQGVSRHSVIKVERAAAREGLDWATAAGMTDREVYERLFPGVGVSVRPVALKVGQVSGKRGGAKVTATVTCDARLDEHPA